MAADLCRRGMSIGGDGVLFIEPSQSADFKMRIFNADGSEAETCGNASRCIALLAHEMKIVPSDMTFETLAGIYQASIRNHQASASLSDPHSFQPDIDLADENIPFPRMHYIDSGVPHVVIFVEDVEKQEVEKFGKLIRHHRYFQPRGTNVNFVENPASSPFRIRTYERGVERETLACGTGCIAAATAAGILHGIDSPAHLLTRSGLVNTVHFRISGKEATNIRLEGEAHIVFRGNIDREFKTLPERECRK